MDAAGDAAANLKLSNVDVVRDEGAEVGSATRAWGTRVRHSLATVVAHKVRYYDGNRVRARLDVGSAGCMLNLTARNTRRKGQGAGKDAREGRKSNKNSREAHDEEVRESWIS